MVNPSYGEGLLVVPCF